MSYINFDKNQLVNLEYSLPKELLRSSREGAYASSTIINCNTRKYHGLLVVPQPAIDGGNHVLLSAFDETLIQHNAEFNLGIRKYQGEVFSPKGHKYLKDFTTEPIPKLTYGVGGIEFTKEMLFSHKDGRMIIKYTLVDAHSPTIIRFKPFLAFRNIHALSKANYDVDTSYESISNGIRLRMYRGYSWVHLQFSKEPDYIHVPDWYYNVEYIKEKARGYDYLEDLYVPGYFEMPIAKGESIYFSAGIEPVNPTTLKKLYTSEIERRVPRDSFENCLLNASQQFIVKSGKKVEVIAGYPWFGRWGRDTFISLPGLTLVTGEFKTAKAAIDTIMQEMRGPLFPNKGIGEQTLFNSADAPLWFFWTLQQYGLYTKTTRKLWKEYGKKLKTILEGFRAGTAYNIKMLDNGLIYAGETGYAVTWMDAVVEGKPVTPRIGCPVEINALWYNALMFAMELASQAGDQDFTNEWKDIAAAFPQTFVNNFWDAKQGYLADYTNGDYKDFSVRPNMVFATSLPYSPVSEDMRNSILERMRSELLTPRGLRSLAPKNPLYKGVYAGNQAQRDMAYHQGSVYPWLLGHFIEGYLSIHGKSGLKMVTDLYFGFKEVMMEHGVGTISEVYDGDPPHKPGGAISQSWSVAELLRINWLIRQYSAK
ncbi:MAG: glycogen debranching enzyme family protein [Bacteroidales bacterium]|nr:glycogen debranching enzyme family protein [Bacteroidales bacterium]MBK9358952.1 glycogen debranching enzyme family protein [Bacteroidales bacterium]